MNVSLVLDKLCDLRHYTLTDLCAFCIKELANLWRNLWPIKIKQMTDFILIFYVCQRTTVWYIKKIIYILVEYVPVLVGQGSRFLWILKQVAGILIFSSLLHSMAFFFCNDYFTPFLFPTHTRNSKSSLANYVPLYSLLYKKTSPDWYSFNFS